MRNFKGPDLSGFSVFLTLCLRVWMYIPYTLFENFVYDIVDIKAEFF